MGDLVSGLSVAGLLLPEAVAYSAIAGLTPGHAIFAAVLGLIVYAIVGQSRFAIIAPTSSSAAILAAAVASFPNADASEKLALAFGLVLVTGFVFIVCGLARLGSLADFIARPVHIDLSPSLAAAASKEACDGSFVSLRSAAPDPADPLLQAVRARIGAAIRPVILAGHDAVRDPLAATFTELADQFQIPVVTTYKAKGLIDESHPLSIGSAGLSPLADEQILPLLQRADLVLMLGYDPIEMRAGWLDPVGDDSRIIELGPHHDHGMHTAGLRVEGAPVGLLNAILSGAQPKALWPEGEAKGVRDRLRDAFEGPAGWGPHQIFKGLREHLPQDALVSVDSGAHRILLSQIWRSARPFGLAQSSGWCTMGSAIPLAIGRKLSHPDSRVVAVLGDGGLEMTLGELGTLRDQGLALTVLVLQDGSLELIGQKQDQAGLLRRAVAMGRTDYAAIARSFGGQGFQVTSETELAIALRSAADLNGFSLIVCEIADHGYAGWI